MASVTLEAQIAALAAMNIDALRDHWRTRWGGSPPPLRSGDLMRRCVAERIQLETLGGDAELDRQLAALVRAHRRGETIRQPKATFRPGTVLVREHDGRTHRVVVTEDGFSWEERSYKSLSQIAREITGVRWNGPKFFGLRDEAAKAGAVE